MYCPCGFSFVSNPPNFEANYNSYLVVANPEYQEFLRREMRVVNCNDDGETRLALIADSARLTGSVLLCPTCSRLYVSLPGKEESWYYKRESAWQYPAESSSQ